MNVVLSCRCWCPARCCSISAWRSPTLWSSRSRLVSLRNTAPQGVQVSTDIASYLSFVMALFMAFGVSFEVPVAIVLLCWMGVTTPEDLRKKRPYVVVGAFVVGMLLTPPDVFSQTLLAIPMYCLFEVGVFFSRFYVGKRRPREEDDEAETGAGREKLKNKRNRPSGRLLYGRKHV